LSWYDGGLKPPRPAGLSEPDQRLFQPRQEGVMYVGDKGILLGGFNGDSPRVVGSSKYQAPPRERGAGGRPRDSAIDQWVAACKGGTSAPLANFEIQAPVTEAFLLGCLAQRLPGEKFQWDTANMRVTNSEKANQWVDPRCRNGYAV
jgi:hypothetical protein